MLDTYHLTHTETGNHLSIVFFEDDVDIGQVKMAITTKAEEIGLHKQPRTAPSTETIYRVTRRG